MTPMGITTLIAEDDDAIRETLRYLLSSAGYAIEEATDGMMALDALLQLAKPCVALIDLTMPKLSGIEVLRRFTAQAADTGPLAPRRFILLTARHTPLPDDDLALLTQLEAPTVFKPFDIDDVLATVEASARRLATD